MVRFEHSQLLNSSVAKVWQVVGDIANWPVLFESWVRVQQTQRSASSIDVVLTDSRSRRYDLSVDIVQPSLTNDAADEHQITVRFDNNHGNPQGYRKISWHATPQGDETQLTLSVDYEKPWPIVGEWLARLRGGGRTEQHLLAAFEVADHESREQALNYHETVQTILSRKGSNVISVEPHDVVSNVCTLINTHRIGAVLVIDDTGRLVGLVSERDVVYHLARTGVGVLNKPVSDIMTRDLIVCEPQSDLLFVMACMTDNKVRHLPVIEDGELKGVISIGDVVQQRIHTLEVESDTLRNYIAAREWRFHAPHGVPVPETIGQTADIDP